MENELSGMYFSRPCVKCDLYDRSQDVDVPIICNAMIDYSAVNEYVRAHYKQSLYFDHDRIEQPIYDGRARQSLYDDEREMLSDNGLAIINMPLEHQIEWEKIEAIERYYIPQLEKIIHDTFHNVTGYCFWNPMMRGESYSISRSEKSETSTANVASMVHIDTDVGAFNLKQFLDVVENNALNQSATLVSTDSAKSIFRQMADDTIGTSKRFAILNFWRNIGPEPVISAPLAIYSTRYDKSHLAFPDVGPSDESKWYIFPNATPDEVIVFYQYDRNIMQTSDLFHCAISTNKVRTCDGRKSFDIRALIIFEEDVPDELDRYKKSRTRPVLSFEESGCFCDEQAKKRKMENS